MKIAIPEDEWEVFTAPTPSAPGWNAEGLGGESASIDPPKEPSWPEATANGTGERGEDRARLHSPAMAGPEEEDLDLPSRRAAGQSLPKNLYISTHSRENESAPSYRRFS